MSKRLTPYQRAMALLRKAADVSPYFLISASGGKDSNVMFPLCGDLQKERPEVRFAALHWYTVPPIEMTGKPGVQCVERPLRMLCARYKTPLFFVPHYNLPDQLFLGEVRQHTIETKFCGRCGGRGSIKDTACAFCEGRGYDRLTKEPCNACVCPRCKGNGQGAQALKVTACEDAGRIEYAASLAGRKRAEFQLKDAEGNYVHSVDELSVHPWRDIWVLLGQRQVDSLERRAMISAFRMQANSEGVAVGGRVGLNVKERRVYPICDWTTDEVHSFVRARGVPPAANLGSANTINMDPSQPGVMEQLKRLYPADYHRVREVFPNARATSDIAGDEDDDGE